MTLCIGGLIRMLNLRTSLCMHEFNEADVQADEHYFKKQFSLKNKQDNIVVLSAIVYIPFDF